MAQEIGPKQIVVTSRGAGYAHEILRGVCGAEVTQEDVEKTFYHQYFGGRGAWVKNGEWGCIRHTD